MISSRKWRKQVEAVLTNKDHPAFMAMSRLIVEQAQGRPPMSKAAEELANTLEELVSGGYERAKVLRAEREAQGPTLVTDGDVIDKSA